MIRQIFYTKSVLHNFEAHIIFGRDLVQVPQPTRIEGYSDQPGVRPSVCDISMPLYDTGYKCSAHSKVAVRTEDLPSYHM